MNYSELKNDVTFWIAGDSTKTIDYTAADILRNINEYYNEVVSMIMLSDGRWEWDDNNQTDLPVGTTNLVANQGDYGISAADYLDIIRVEMKDPSGNWIQLTPMSYSDRSGTAIAELDDTTGTPTYYDKVGNSVILHTIPNYSSSGGLKIYFHRPPSYFIVSDTTKTPGFNPLYHRYLSLGAAVDYCAVNGMQDRLNILLPKMAQMKLDIMSSYSRRSKDEHLFISLHREDFGNSEAITNENSVG